MIHEVPHATEPLMITYRLLPFGVAAACVPTLFGQSFSDQAATAGVTTTFENSAYAAWADFDGDGDQDVFLGINGGSFEANDILYRNNGDGTFTDVAGPAGVLGHTALSFQFGAAWADYDRDGDLDLFVASSLANELFRNNGNGTFTDVAVQAGVDLSTSPTGCAWGDVDSNGWPDLIVSNWNAPEQLHLNQGDGTFLEVAGSAGCAGGNAPTAGVSFTDYDGDGNLDLYVSIPGLSTQNTLYRGDGLGGFVDVTTAAGLLFDSSWAAAWADSDNDGDLDLFVPEMTPPANISGRHYLNLGNGTFAEVGSASGLRFTHVDGQNPRGSAWADFDNDGDLDLYVVFNITSSGGLPATNFLFRNNGNGTFTDVATGAGTADGSFGNGVAIADYDDDGFLDIFVVNEWTFACNLYRNLGSTEHWTRLHLTGVTSDTHGLGARVGLKTSGASQLREVTGGGTGKSCQDDYPVQFGLGASSIIDELDVYWPSGVVDHYFNLPADEALWLWEGGEVGTAFCGPAVANSSGVAAEAHVWGSTRVADNALVLQATHMPPQVFGYFIVSATQGYVQGPGGSQGNLCLGGNIGRFGSQVQLSSQAGHFDIAPDLTNLPGLGAVPPGATLHFQAWFRDKNPSATSNFTDGTAVTFS